MDWRHLKDFQHPTEIGWVVDLRDDDAAEKLWLGFKPKDMDEKWFIASEAVISSDGDEAMRVGFWRSWTSKKIVEIVVENRRIVKIVFEGVDGGGTVGDVAAGCGNIKAETLEEKGERMKMLVREVCRWVLGFEIGNNRDGIVKCDGVIQVSE
jgi:hypothetical protein